MPAAGWWWPNDLKWVMDQEVFNRLFRQFAATYSQPETIPRIQKETVSLQGISWNMIIRIEDFINDFHETFRGHEHLAPWEFTAQLPEILIRMIEGLEDGFVIRGNMAIHRTAVVDSTAVLTGPAIIDANARIGQFALIRNGAYIGREATIGAHGEFKNSIIMHGSTCGHFNFAGESLIGNGVNLEAGAVLANHHNELEDQPVNVKYDEQWIPTGQLKFGSVIGDGSRIGANAVIAPGTLLPCNSVVARLQLVDNRS